MRSLIVLTNKDNPADVLYLKKFGNSDITLTEKKEEALKIGSKLTFDKYFSMAEMMYSDKYFIESIEVKD